jgi:ribitol-5-phosphate 2-dehydrogenase (NADP+) / D-ribitol-5-phosphate cytidylyltransferase
VNLRTLDAPTPPALRTVAVVLAGGTGARVGLATPKQLLKVAGRTLLEHTVKNLGDCPEIDEIIVVMAADYVSVAAGLLLGRPGFEKVTRIHPGGTNRNRSTVAALATLGDDECNVLLHDAVRPLLPPAVVSACVEALRDHEAVDVAIASADTIVRVDADECIADIPDRSMLRRGQTPQAFRLSTLRRAYELAAADEEFTATDDCGVVLRYLPEVRIKTVAGDEQNMKVTYPIDLVLVDRLFQLSSHAATRHDLSGRRERLEGKVVVIIGGSYGIGADVAELAGQAGCRVYPLSRSTTDTDVRDPAGVRAALDEVAQEAGRIDAVVVTAAELTVGPLVDLSDARVDEQIAVNFGGAVHAARASEPHLRATGGHLVFFTSSSYTRGRANYALYSSTKAAVVNLAQALADEWSAASVHVNTINPERTRSPMRLKAFGAEPEDELLDSTTVAATVIDVLASDLTGLVFDVRKDY